MRSSFGIFEHRLKTLSATSLSIIRDSYAIGGDFYFITKFVESRGKHAARDWSQNGDRYLNMLEACEATIAKNVTENLYERHLKPLFPGKLSSLSKKHVRAKMDLAELTKIYDFTGRSVVVTGGTGVLGSVIVKALVGCGANVAVLARNRDKAAALLSEISGPDRVTIVAGDALKLDDLQQAAQAVVKEFGRIDCLINGAGGNHPQATTRPDLLF